MKRSILDDGIERWNDRNEESIQRTLNSKKKRRDDHERRVFVHKAKGKKSTPYTFAEFTCLRDPQNWTMTATKEHTHVKAQKKTEYTVLWL